MYIANVLPKALRRCHTACKAGSSKTARRLYWTLYLYLLFVLGKYTESAFRQRSLGPALKRRTLYFSLLTLLLTNGCHIRFQHNKTGPGPGLCLSRCQISMQKRLKPCYLANGVVSSVHHPINRGCVLVSDGSNAAEETRFLLELQYAVVVLLRSPSICYTMAYYFV